MTQIKKINLIERNFNHNKVWKKNSTKNEANTGRQTKDNKGRSGYCGRGEGGRGRHPEVDCVLRRNPASLLSPAAAAAEGGDAAEASADVLGSARLIEPFLSPFLPSENEQSAS
jgi:hypothetical protein